MITITLTYHRAMLRAYVAIVDALRATERALRAMRRACVIAAARHSSAFWGLGE